MTDGDDVPAKLSEGNYPPGLEDLAASSFAGRKQLPLLNWLRRPYDRCFADGRRIFTKHGYDLCRKHARFRD